MHLICLQPVVNVKLFGTLIFQISCDQHTVAGTRFNIDVALMCQHKALQSVYVTSSTRSLRLWSWLLFSNIVLSIELQKLN